MSLKLIGFYPTDDQAEHAREDLRNAGFGSIHLYHGDDVQQADNAMERTVAKEAARRHATALMLDADENVSLQVLHILRRHHPVGMARAHWPEHAGSMQPQRRDEQAAQPAPAPETHPEAPSPFAEAPQDASQKTELEVIFSAKRFVSEIAGDDRFRGRDWHEIEPFVQKEFEQHYPNESWEEHLPAIMLGYARAIEGR